MIKLPLKHGGEICLFDNHFTLHKSIKTRRQPMGDPITEEIVYLYDGRNGAWEIDLSFEDALDRIHQQEYAKFLADKERN
jgi:hypothetical protein